MFNGVFSDNPQYKINFVFNTTGYNSDITPCSGREKTTTSSTDSSSSAQSKHSIQYISYALLALFSCSYKVLDKGNNENSYYYRLGGCQSGYVCDKLIRLYCFGSNSNVCQFGLICLNGKCENARFAAVGESCEQNSDCADSDFKIQCINKVCVNPVMFALNSLL
ncbi:hypothetical protein ACTFIR_003535 [Dictyostelium discoideum]